MAKAKGAKRQLGLKMRANLYNGLAKHAKANGQTVTYVLERAAEHYLEFVAPTETTVRPEIMSLARKSITRNHKLLQLLAQ